MKAGSAFQLTETPLAPGTTLLEASAGTGKTTTIAVLFLRLILERDMPVREILVVTFTEAATEELRDRIRKTLSDAAAGFRAGTSANAVIAPLIPRHLPHGPEMLGRLDRALCGFDEAPIFTIHSFCQRTLKDRAFENGALFDMELLTDDAELVQELVDDYWRQRFYEAEPLLVSFALKNGVQPEWFLPLLRLHQRHPGLEVLSPVAGRPFDRLAKELQGSFRQARDVWAAQKATITELVNPEARWAIGDHAKAGVVAEMLALAEDSFASDEPLPESLAALEFFSSSEIKAGTGARSESPTHPFFARCENVGGREKDFLAGLRIDFLAYAKAELPRRKERRKAQSFDDLLTRLRDTLTGPGALDLVREVRSKYQAALIDEFQDTDPVQYEIFRRLFADPNPASGAPGTGTVACRREESRRTGARTKASSRRDSGAPLPLLFLIGDPKQAIYGFRGADIFTYLEAAGKVDQCFTLEKNWRSEKRLVQAVNILFGSVDKPFVFDEIRFQPVQAGGETDKKPLTENGRAQPPLHLWFLPRAQGATSIPKTAAEATLPGLIAAEILRLLSGDARLGTEKLSPRDIAVLVLENRQARLMQAALRERDIPSVLHTEESVFASPEARELARVLGAIARPGHERLLRAALATDLLGVSGAELEALTRDEAGWEQRLARSHQYHDRWVERGFTPMLREWLQQENVRQRVLRFADGERRLTNLLHLAEALHQAAQERRCGPSGLVHWLGERIASVDKAAEEHQLRLERDDQAVRLVTVHKSKGLQYPIVFCPFSWKPADIKRDREDQVLFHRRGKGQGGAASAQFIYDLGSPHLEEHRRLALREKLAEQLRLLYVAVTRARNRCYFVWGAFRNAGLASAAWLFHRPPELSDDLDASMSEHFKKLDDAALLRDLGRLVDRSEDEEGQRTIQLSPIPPPGPERYSRVDLDEVPLQARVFTGRIGRDWRIASFSTITAGLREELPDYDRLEPTVPRPCDADAEASGIFAFPRGTAPGTCLHKIFEELDFTQSTEGALERLVREKLQTHGYAPEEFAPAVAEAIRRALTVPLEPTRTGLTLSRIANGDRLNELEFYFPVQSLSAAVWQAGFAGFARTPEFATQLERLDFKAAGGFIKGYIDLVFRFGDRFYIADWKSNWLGNRVEDYGPGALAREMSEKFYTLQYHLYTVALHQYLSLRLPGYAYEKHFGGVFYLFVRGIDPARPELGVYRDHPAAQLVRQLSERLSVKPKGTRS